MRVNRLCAVISLAAIAALILVGCVLAPVTIEQRISKFASALNGERTKAYTNLVEGSPEFEANKNKADLWDIHFPLSTGDPTPFAITLDAYSNPSDVQATITGPGGYNKNAKFVMVNSGSLTEDWRIDDLMLEVAGPSWQSIFGP